MSQIVADETILPYGALARRNTLRDGQQGDPPDPMSYTTGDEPLSPNAWENSHDGKVLLIIDVRKLLNILVRPRA